MAAPSPFAELAETLVQDLKAARYDRGDLDGPAALGMAPRSSPEGQPAPSFDAANDDLIQDVRLRAVEASSGVKYHPHELSDPEPPAAAAIAPDPEDQIDWSDPALHALAAEHFTDDEPLSLEDTAVIVDYARQNWDALDEDEQHAARYLADGLAAEHSRAIQEQELAEAIATGTATYHQQMVHLSDPANAAAVEAHLADMGYDLDQLKRLAAAHDWDWGQALDALEAIGPVAAGLDGALDNTLAEARHIRGAA